MNLEKKIDQTKLTMVDFAPLPGVGLLNYYIRNRNPPQDSDEKIIKHFSNSCVLLLYNFAVTTGYMYLIAN